MLLFHSDHLSDENSWLHMWKKWLITRLLSIHTSRAEKKLFGAVLTQTGCRHMFSPLSVFPLPSQSHPLPPTPGLIRTRIHQFLKIVTNPVYPPLPITRAKKGQPESGEPGRQDHLQDHPGRTFTYLEKLKRVILHSEPHLPSKKGSRS